MANQNPCGRKRLCAGVLCGLVLWSTVEPLWAHLAIIRQGAECGGQMETNDQYGRALAVGDFNADGYEDLAVGAPYEDVDTMSGLAVGAGAVFVNYGCPTGLTNTGYRILTQDYLGSSSETGDQFGWALAAGDFDHDGYADLAVGSPGEDTTSGAVFVIYGSAAGLTNARWNVIGQGNSVGTNEAGDSFGWSLASGDFNGDDRADLVVGVPGEDLEMIEGTISTAGAVNIYYGAVTGLSVSGAIQLTDAQTGGDAQDGAWFGLSVAAGDLNGDGWDDVVVGIPFKEASGQPNNHGMVEVLFGSAAGVTTAGYVQLDGNSIGFAPIGDDRFGWSVAVGRADNDAYADLAIGAPFRGILSDAGEAYVVYGGSAGPNPATAVACGITGNVSNMQRGYALAFGDWTGDGYDDLAVGAPGWLSGQGQVVIHASSPAGDGLQTSAALSTVRTQENLNEISEAEDWMGLSLAFGAFAGGTRKGLAVGVPGEDYEPFPGSLASPQTDSGQVLIDMPWLQVQNMTCRGAMLTGCNDEILFSFKAFEPHLLASTTKIMTALLACEATQPGCNPCANLNDVYTVPTALCDPATVPGGLVGGSTANLCPGEQITFQNLLYSCMYPSGNDAAFSIADHLFNPGQNCVDNTCQDIFDFADLMNQRAAELGMTTAFFQHPSGAAHGATWPSRNVASANDMARLAYFAMQNPLFNAIASGTNWPMTRVNYLCGPTNVNWCTGATPVTGCGVPDFPNATGIKPGGTPPAGSTFVASVDHPEGRFFAVTLGHPNANARRAEVNAMLTLAANVFCTGPFVPQPPPPGKVLKAPQVPAGPGGTTGFKIDLDQGPDKPVNVQVSLSQGTSSAEFDLRLTRKTQIGLQVNETATQTIAPFDGRGGLVITNIGEDPADIRIETDQPPQQLWVTLASGESHILPPYTPSAPQAGAALDITFLGSSGMAYLDVAEVDYAFARNLAGDGAFNIRLTATHFMGEDSMDVVLYGLDDDPSAAVDLLIAHTHDADPGCDGTLDVNDIPPFIAALIDPDGYELGYEGCFIGSADRNGDGFVDGRDISHFVDDLLAVP